MSTVLLDLVPALALPKIDVLLRHDAHRASNFWEDANTSDLQILDQYG